MNSNDSLDYKITSFKLDEEYINIMRHTVKSLFFSKKNDLLDVYSIKKKNMF